MKPKTEEQKTEVDVNPQSNGQAPKPNPSSNLFENLGPQEMMEMQQYINRRAAQKKCKEEIDVILQKYNASLVVNGESPVNNIQVMVVLNN